MRGPAAYAAVEGLTSPQRERLQRFTVELRASPHNLMSPAALEALWSRHVPECVALARRLPEGIDRVADVGTGGGLPGIVIAIMRPELSVTLIESTGKKARFCEMVGRRLGLALDVANERVEDLRGSEWSGAFDVVTARAVAPLRQLIPWSLPLVRPDGRLYAVKGEQWREDLEEARETLPAGSFRVVESPEEHTRTLQAEPRVVILAPPPEADHDADADADPDGDADADQDGVDGEQAP